MKEKKTGKKERRDRKILTKLVYSKNIERKGGEAVKVFDKLKERSINVDKLNIFFYIFEIYVIIKRL